jgi:hypothetical protein
MAYVVLLRQVDVNEEPAAINGTSGIRVLNRSVVFIR